MTWNEEVISVIEALRGRAAQRLVELASTPPTGPDVFPAWAAIEKQLGLANAVDPVVHTQNVLGHEQDQRADALAALVRSLAAAVDKAIDGGANDETDPLFRPRDLSVLTIGGGLYQSWKAARVDPIKSWTEPAGPPLPESLRDVPTYRLSDGTRVLLLGRSLPRFIRRSCIVRINAAAHDDQFHESLEAERVAAAERARLATEADRLERRAKELRGASAGGGWADR